MGPLKDLWGVYSVEERSCELKYQSRFDLFLLRFENIESCHTLFARLSFDVKMDNCCKPAISFEFIGYWNDCSNLPELKKTPMHNGE